VGQVFNLPFIVDRKLETCATMKIDILTLFPEICRAPLSESMMKRAQENKIVDLRIH